jgi:hypothetical protein
MFNKKVFVRINSKLKDPEGKMITYDGKLIATEEAKEYFLKFDDAVFKGTTFYLELINDLFVSIPVSEIYNIMLYPEDVLKDD